MCVCFPHSRQQFDRRTPVVEHGPLKVGLPELHRDSHQMAIVDDGLHLHHSFVRSEPAPQRDE